MHNTSSDMDHISDELIAYLRDELKNPEIEYRSPKWNLMSLTDIVKRSDDLTKRLRKASWPYIKVGADDMNFGEVLQLCNAFADLGFHNVIL